MTLTNLNQKSLRKTIRKQRLALTPRQRKLASYQAFRHLTKLPTPLINHFSNHLPNRTKIGIYLDAFGEMPVSPIISWAKRHQFDLYLPSVIAPNKPLQFIKMSHYQTNHWRLIKHTLGMYQPANLRHAINVHQLDILFMPLVALDIFGYRMGMGGGFYDRTLAKTKTKPIKIGWAYDFQLVEKLDIQPWDVPLDFAILPRGIKVFRRYLVDLPQHDFQQNLPDNEQLSNDLIAQVMNIERLEELLNRANAFGVVNSEDFLS